MAKKKTNEDFDALFSQAVDAVSSSDKQEMEIEIELADEAPRFRSTKSSSSTTNDEFDIDLDAELAALGEPAEETLDDAELIIELRAQLEEATAEREHYAQQLQKAKRINII